MAENNETRKIRMRADPFNDNNGNPVDIYSHILVTPETNNEGKVTEAAAVKAFAEGSESLANLTETGSIHEFSERLFGEGDYSLLLDSNPEKTRRDVTNGLSKEFNKSVAGYAPAIAHNTARIDSRSLERSVFSNSFKAFKISDEDIASAGSKETKEFMIMYNNVATCSQAHQNFSDARKENGDEIISSTYLGNLTPEQLRLINIRAGGNIDDLSKVADILQEGLKQKAVRAMGSIGGVGTYSQINLQTGARLEEQYQSEFKTVEDAYKTKRTELKLRGKFTEMAEEDHAFKVTGEALNEKYQNAGKDAKSAYRGFINTAKNAIRKESNKAAYMDVIRRASKA